MVRGSPVLSSGREQDATRRPTKIFPKGEARTKSLNTFVPKRSHLGGPQSILVQSKRITKVGLGTKPRDAERFLDFFDQK